ncbi:hypothetical protein [Streptomyces chartreusis]|uniref:hypothetical protein n=1 Tax=Streptomyces chartreusis TaxID=1969 RepID=UPI002E810B30|nr:hypothetical protein [Streptomyces chartreusis]WUB23795.1 hypothetical protein OG997_44455 [Streptomyces chartreusis]
MDVKDQRGDRQQLIEVKNYLRYSENHKEMRDGKMRKKELFVRLEGEIPRTGESGRTIKKDQINKDWHVKRNKQGAGINVDVIWVFPGAHPSNALRAALTSAGFTVIVVSV